MLRLDLTHVNAIEPTKPYPCQCKPFLSMLFLIECYNTTQLTIF